MEDGLLFKSNVKYWTALLERIRREKPTELRVYLLSRGNPDQFNFWELVVADKFIETIQFGLMTRLIDASTFSRIMHDYADFGPSMFSESYMKTSRSTTES
jgi:hypothetical protein